MTLLQKVCNDFFRADMAISVKAKKGAKGIKRKRHDENLLHKEAMGHPSVEEALRVFNGKISDIKITREAI